MTTKKRLNPQGFALTDQSPKGGFTLIDQSAKRGFTLIELSIVLVIIGLIVGGVLVGQDLIKAAQIRATVGQMEKYNAAANTFRNKYNGLPGDLLNPGNYFAVTACASPGTIGCADGNGLIQGAGDTYTSGVGTGIFTGEPILFWGMLATAGLTPDLTNTLDYTATPAANADTTQPQAKMGKQVRFGVIAQNSINYFIMGKPTTAAVSAAVWNLGLTPTEAYQIDSKMDDGAPGTGTVLSIAASASGTGPAPATYSAGSCATSTTAYAIASAATGNIIECELGIRTSF